MCRVCQMSISKTKINKKDHKYSTHLENMCEQICQNQSQHTIQRPFILAPNPDYTSV